MPQPKRSTGTQRKRRTGGAARTTKSTAAGRKSAGGGRQAQRRPSARPKAEEAGVEAAAERIRDLNERAIDAGKRGGRVTLDVYESTLKAMADSLERGPGASDIDLVSRLATSQANFIRDLTKAWTSAARKALK